MTEKLVINSKGLMTISMTDDLSIWQWLVTPEGEELLARACVSPSVAEIASLRKKWSADQVRVGIEFVRAREKAGRKFPEEIANRLVADDQGIQMASSFVASEYKARRMREILGEGNRVVDLCCGIGGDAIGLACAGFDVTGVDLDPMRVWMTEHNAGVKGAVGDVLEFEGEFDGFHLDPSRRDAEGVRTREGGEFLPAMESWGGIVERFGRGCIKVGPGVDPGMFECDEFEVLSEAGSLTQGLLWFGVEGKGLRRATRIEKDGRVCSVVGEPGRMESLTDIGSYIATIDPSVERVDLIGQVVEESGCDFVHPGTGLVTSRHCPKHGMLTAFMVMSVMSWREDAVREVIRDFEGGIVEVKTRDGVVDTDVMQKRLRGDGDLPLVVFVYRFGKKVKAIITERVQTEENPCEMNLARGEEGGC